MEFTPKMGCDADGNACLLGNRGAKCGPWGCAPAINTKFSGTFASDSSGTDSFDTNLANGFTVPFKLTVGPECATGIPANNVKGANIDCSALALSECPTQSALQIGTVTADVDLKLKHPPSGNSAASGWTQVVGCWSPCSILTLDQGTAPAAVWNPP